MLDPSRSCETVCSCCTAGISVGRQNVRHVSVSITFVLALSMLAVCGCLSSSTHQEDWVSHHSLYHRLGGRTVIEKVVGDFLEIAFRDGDLHFSRIKCVDSQQTLEQHKARLRERMIDYLCMATGSTVVYEGADLRTVHESMHIASDEYRRVIRHFDKALRCANVRARERVEFLQLIGDIEGSIVDRGMGKLVSH